MTSLLVPALGSYGPGDRNRRDGTSRGVAVAAISRRSGKQAAVVDTRCAFRRSASLSYRERGPLNLPLTRDDLRAAMTLAWMKGARPMKHVPDRAQKPAPRLSEAEARRGIYSSMSNLIDGW